MLLNRFKIFFFVYVFVGINLFQVVEAAADWQLNTNGNWNVDANWDTATFPNGITANDEAFFPDIFSSPIVVNLGQDIITPKIDSSSFYGVTISNDGFSLTFDTMGADAVLDASNFSPGDFFIECPVVLMKDLDVGLTTRSSYTISGGISGAQDVIKGGGGELIFSGASPNTYNSTVVDVGTLILEKPDGTISLPGDVTINPGTPTRPGTVELNSANQFASTSNTVLSGGVLDMNGNDTEMGSFTYSSGTFTQGGATLTLASAGTALTMEGTTITGDIELTGSGGVSSNLSGTTATISGNIGLGNTEVTFSIAEGVADPDMRISGVISTTDGGVTGGIIKDGVGTLELTGSSPNSFIGTTTVTVEAGTLLLNKDENTVASSPNINVKGGQLISGASGQLPSSAFVNIDGGSYDMAGFSESIFSAAISNGTLTPGQLTLVASGDTLSMRGGGMILDGGTVIISGAGAIRFGNFYTGNALIEGTLNLSTSSRDFTIQSGTEPIDMSISGVIIGDPGSGITKLEAGTLELTGSSANTFSGLTTVTEGTLLLSKTLGNAIAGNILINGGILSAGANNQIVDTATMTIDGGSYNMGAFSETINELIINNGSVTPGSLTLTSSTTALTMKDSDILAGGTVFLSGTGSVDFDSSNAGTATIAGGLDLSTVHNFNIEDNGGPTTDMILSGVVSGLSGGITKLGAGTLELSGSVPNTFEGLTSVTEGTLSLNKDDNVVAIPKNLSINSGGTLSLAATNQFASASAVSLVSGGTFNMNGNNTEMSSFSFTGGTLTQGGAVLSLASSGTALTMEGTIIPGNIALTGSGTVAPVATGTTAEINGGIALSGASTFFILDGGADPDMILQGPISGAGGITKTGAGSLEIAGSDANTFSGLTTVTSGELRLNKTPGINAVGGPIVINAGTLKLLASEQISSGSIMTINGGSYDMNGESETMQALVFNGGTLTPGSLILTAAAPAPALTMQNSTILAAGMVTLSGTGSVDFDNTMGGVATIASSLDLSTVHDFNIEDSGSSATDMVLSGVVSGAGGITKLEAGTLELTGSSANTFVGDTAVTAGTLLLNKDNDVVAIPGNLTINSGGTLSLEATNQFSSVSTVSLLSGGTFNMNGNQTLMGSFSFTGGTFNQGGGSLSLASAGTALTMEGTAISGNVALVGGGAVFSTLSGTVATISGNVDLVNDEHTFSVADGVVGSDMVISGVIGGAGGAALTKENTGTLELTGIGANTFGGLTTVTDGTLSLNKTPGVVAIPGNLTIPGGTVLLNASGQIATDSTVTLSGGTWNLNNNNTSIATFNFTSGTYTPGGATLTLSANATALTMEGTTITGNIELPGSGTVFTSSSGTIATINGDVDLGSDIHIFSIATGLADPDMRINGIISGINGGITKTDGGTLELTGSAPNTFTGVTTIIDGELRFSKDANVNAVGGPIVINGGTLAAGNNEQIADSSTLTIDSGSYVMNGLTETITALIFNGGTVTPGSLTLTSSTTALTMKDTDILAGGTVFLSGTGSVDFDSSNAGTATIAGGLDLSTVHNFNIEDNGGPTTDMILSGVVSGLSGGITKLGAGTLELSGSVPNTFEGLTSVTEGTLSLNKDDNVVAIPKNLSINSGGTLSLAATNQFASASAVSLVSGGTFNMNGNNTEMSSFSFTGGTLTQGGAVLSLGSAGTALTMEGTIIPGNIALTGGGTVAPVATGTTAEINGGIALSGASTFSIADGGADPDMRISGVINGAGGITKTGDGSLELAGTIANTFSGLTTVTSGELRLNKTPGINAVGGPIVINAGTLKLLASEQISSGSIMTINGGSYDMNGESETMQALVFNGGTLTAGSLILTAAAPAPALTMQNSTILAAGMVTLSGTGSVDFDNTMGGMATIASSLDLSTVHDFNIKDSIGSNPDMILSGVVSGAGGITKLEAGTLELTGSSANTFVGDTAVTAGTLLLNKDNDVVAIPGNLTINSGGTLSLAATNQFSSTSEVSLLSGTFNMNGNDTLMGSFSFTGGTFSQGGAVLSLASSGTALTMEGNAITGNIVLTGSGAVSSNAAGTIATISGDLDLGVDIHEFSIAGGGADPDMRINGTISGTGGITKTEVGTLEISGSSANTFSGLTTVAAGELLLNKTAGINAVGGPIVVDGGTLKLLSSEQIADSSTLTIESGLYDMNGFSETIETLIFSGGTLTAADLTLTSNTTALNMKDSDILAGGAVILSGSGDVSFTGALGTAMIESSLDLSTFDHNFNIANGGAPIDMSIGGVISGSGGITKLGDGTLELKGSSSNTFTGLTKVMSGELRFSKDPGVNAVGGPIVIDGGTLTAGNSEQIADAATLTIESGSYDMGAFSETITALIFNGGTVTPGSLTLTSSATALTMKNTDILAGGTITLSGTGSVNFDNSNAGTATIASGLDLTTFDHNFNIANGSAAVDMSITGVISGTGGIHKLGDGTLQLAGSSSNTFMGTTTVTAGKLELSNTIGNAIAEDILINGGTLSSGASDQIANTSTLTIESGSYQMNGFSETIDTLIFNGGVLNAGILSLNSSTAALTMRDSEIFAGGTVVLSGSGSVNFDSSNNGTAVIGSGLALSALSHDFNIQNGTVATDMSINGIISGVGGMQKNGFGTLELTGTSANTFTGTTTVTAGTLLLNKPSSTNAVGGPIVINGGTVKLLASDQILDSSVMTINGGLYDMNGFTEVMETLIFNGGSVGAANLILSSNGIALTMRDSEILAGGNVTLSGTGSVTFDSSNNGTAIIGSDLALFSPSHGFNIQDGLADVDMSISGVISGAGGITKTGLGTLLFTGINNYSGGTTVSSGILQGDTNSLQGNIANESTLIFDQDFDGVFSGQMTGALGTFIKKGAGRLNLTNTNSIGGLATVENGILAVNGSLAGAGSLTVEAAGTLKGTGTITKNITLFGMLAPGNSIGTITLIGDQTFGSGSVLENEFNSVMGDLVDITGSLTIDPGAGVNLLLLPDSYIDSFTYTMVQTTTGVTGTFSTVQSSLPLFDGVVIYTPTTILLEGTFLPISTLINQGNAGAVAKCISDLPKNPGYDLAFVVGQLQNIPTEEELQAAVVQLQPSLYTSLSIAVQDDMVYLRNVINNHLDEGTRCCRSFNKCWNLWAAPFVGFTTQSSLNDEPGFWATSPGGFVGLDAPDRCCFSRGGGLGFTHTSLKWKHSRGNATIDTIYALLYGKWRRNNFAIQSTITGAYNNYETKREIQFTGSEPFNRTARGTPNGFEGAFNLKAEYLVKKDSLQVVPYASIDYIYLYRESFKESGAGSLNLKVEGYDADLLISEAGLELASCCCTNYGQITPYLQLGAIRENRFKGKKQKALIEGCPFTVKGMNPTRTLVNISAGLRYEVCDSIQFSTYYKGKYNKSFYDNSAYLEISKVF